MTKSLKKAKSCKNVLHGHTLAIVVFYGPAWSSMDIYCPLWSSIDPQGVLWSFMLLSDLEKYNMVPKSLLRSHMILYDHDKSEVMSDMSRVISQE